MVANGPQKYPGASTAHWYQNSYPGTTFEANVVVWHTTEGTSLPGYGGGASAPNLTAVPDISRKRLVWHQHYDIDRSSRALENRSGGVETNSANALQVELVGTCDPPTRDKWNREGREFIFWPDAPDWALAELAHFVEWLYVNHRIRRESTVTWKAYPSSYGNTSTRLTGDEWNEYYGHLGHQHVPENSHGDPGNLNFKRIIELALGAVTGGDDVALTTSDINKVAKAVVDALTVTRKADLVRAIFRTDDVIDSPNHEGNPHWTANSYVKQEYLRTVELQASVAELKAQVAALAAGGVDEEALADKLADKLAERFAQ